MAHGSPAGATDGYAARKMAENMHKKIDTRAVEIAAAQVFLPLSGED
jgi:hypothetical protein